MRPKIMAQFLCAAQKSWKPPTFLLVVTALGVSGSCRQHLRPMQRQSSEGHKKNPAQTTRIHALHSAQVRGHRDKSKVCLRTESEPVKKIARISHSAKIPVIGAKRLVGSTSKSQMDLPDICWCGVIAGKNTGVVEMAAMWKACPVTWIMVANNRKHAVWMCTAMGSENIDSRAGTCRATVWMLRKVGTKSRDKSRSSIRPPVLATAYQ
mmetsp:Transcript_136972/g.273197  ORF Transcript_136972/g.273197 Transcript_136972/m.273197 type:complete len:209 (-) Transcript_136972:517-1143(-)